ncbi:hypothetical protein SRRS_17330 [Sporomusa rhizae]|uniref:hypothetical protein n=1 Tax=Sporomusa rhizae TaxID=357999 RepID=UPI00352B7A50
MKEETDFLDIIEADWVIVEVADKNTGKKFRRNLPVRYLETDNGVTLFGETLDGEPSEISFLSDAALAKINDLMGKGPDHSRCESKGSDGVP